MPLQQDCLIEWYLSLDKLITWAANYGYLVEFVEKGENVMWYLDKIIEINSLDSLETQVYCLLHECGHALIMKNERILSLNEKIRGESKDEESDAYKVFVMIDEIEAWKRGRNLAKRLMIPVNDRRWEEQMVCSLKNYINWASFDCSIKEC